MKPWLLNVLACPIDKHHPLDAYFFKWETTEAEQEKINREAGKSYKFFSKQYQHLTKQIVDGTISLPSIRAIKDQSDSRYSLELLGDVLKFLNILEFEEGLTKDELLSKFPEGVDILYRYLNLLELEEGLLRCPECNRWYPIGRSVESIPELMPDDLREEAEEIEWLRKWIDKLPESVKTDGEPFKP